MPRIPDKLPSLPEKEALILQLLLRHDELYGLDLVARSKGALKRGTVYVTLGRMEKKGFIESRQEAPPVAEGGLPRRLYAATAFGTRVYEVWNALARDMRRLHPEFAS